MHPLSRNLPQQKIVIQVQTKAMALVAATGGVDSVVLDG